MRGGRHRGSAEAGEASIAHGRDDGLLGAPRSTLVAPKEGGFIIPVVGRGDRHTFGAL